MIDRAITSRIKEDIGFFSIVSIIGPRQVGKTTLAKQLGSQLSKTTLDLELDTDAQKLVDAQTYLQQHTNKRVVLDEIQRMPRLFPLLRALVDQQREPARFILLGSSSPNLLRESSESLAGRISYIELMPFSWPEVIPIDSMAMHWLKGGFPEAFLAPRLPLTFRWLPNFVQTYIERDIRALGYELSGPVLSKLLSMIAHLNSSILNVSDLARSLGVSQPTVNRYSGPAGRKFRYSSVTTLFYQCRQAVG